MLKKVLHVLLFSLTLTLLTSNTVKAQFCDSQTPCPPGFQCDTVDHRCEDLGFNVNIGPTNDTFDAINPLKLNSTLGDDELDTPGEIVSRVLEFAFPLAGLILFVMIVWGGFEMVAGAQEKKSLDSGKQRVTAAIVGFLLLFSSYWIAQIIEFIFGISIL